MKTLFSIVFSCLILTIFGQVKADDLEAQSKCKAIHHTDVDLPETAYLNGKCLLNCNIHGRIWTHMMNEDLPCSGRDGICKSGSCVASTVLPPQPTPRPNPNAHLGYIDIEMESASFATPANAYASVCIQNYTTGDLSLPIVDRSQCTTCVTSTISNTLYPVWNSICSGSGSIIFSEDSRITFEVFDNFATGSQVFVGGASLTIPQLLSHGDSHKRLHLAIVGGHVAGQINARVTWTPKL